MVHWLAFIIDLVAMALLYRVLGFEPTVLVALVYLIIQGQAVLANTR